MLKFPSPHDRVLPANIQCIRAPIPSQDGKTLDRIIGSLVGLAVGDALGASVEFRPREYLVNHPVNGMQSGGTWGLQAGQWTDDTSMALCLASSLIIHGTFHPYDQMVRYKWWYKYGYLSSTGHCFDIGNATRASLDEFCRRQNDLKKNCGFQTEDEVDNLSFEQFQQIQHAKRFNVNCGRPDTAGNGALMRLAPVPLFFYRVPSLAVELSGESARLTHGDNKAVDACRYYGALIVAAIHGETKDKLLSNQFYNDHRDMFGSIVLHEDVRRVAEGSYKKLGGSKDGIRGKGHVIWALEAALWAFWSDDDSFHKGVLKAVNLGDDTDTTAAIYGQLAGAYYGYRKIPSQWTNQLYAKELIICIAEWLYAKGMSYNQAPQQQREASNRILPASSQQQTSGSHSTSQQGNPFLVSQTPTQHQRSTPSHMSSETKAPTKITSTMPAAGVTRGANQQKLTKNQSTSWDWYRDQGN